MSRSPQGDRFHFQAQVLVVALPRVVFEPHHPAHRRVLLLHRSPLPIGVIQHELRFALLKLFLDLRVELEVFPGALAPLDERVHHPRQPVADFAATGPGRGQEEQSERVRAMLQVLPRRRRIGAAPVAAPVLGERGGTERPATDERLVAGQRTATAPEPGLVHAGGQGDAPGQLGRELVAADFPARDGIFGGADHGGKLALRSPHEPPQFPDGCVRFGFHSCMIQNKYIFPLAAASKIGKLYLDDRIQHVRSPDIMNDTAMTETSSLPPPDLEPTAPASGPTAPRFPQAKGESDRAFEAFRAYLELGPRRRYAAVVRKVGASLRTVKRWASDFDWRGRIQTYAADAAEQFAETEQAAQREELLDATARAKVFRDRQYALAEGLLDAAERYLERVEGDDLDQMRFADACKALEIASRIGQPAERRATDDASAPARSLRDQLAALLEQVYREAPSPNGATVPSPVAHGSPPPSS